MAIKQLKSKSYDDFSKGCWQSASDTLAPENSVKLNLNLDSDEIIGSLVSRYGSTLITGQLEDTKAILGLHNYRDSLGSVNKLFAVVNDSADTNADIYDVVAGTKSLADDTASLKARFLSYLNACLRLNGTDDPAYYNGTSWQTSPTGAAFTAATTDIITDVAHGLLDGDIVVLTTTDTLPAGLSLETNYYVRDKADDTFKVALTSGGTAVDITDTGAGTHTWAYWDPFDVANIPTGAKYAVEFRDRVYVAGMSTDPDRVDYSGIADSTTRDISWSTDNGFIIFEQEDGGGGITGLAKVPNYLLVFKKRTLKRYDGSSAYPEDMINQGAPSQEAIAVAQGKCFWVNENGAWATTGGEPKNIGTYTVDAIIKSCSATNLANVASGTDEEHVFWSFASVTMNGETYTNVVIKYNIFQNTWDIRQYPTLPRAYAKYVDSSDNVFLTAGDDDGNVLKMDTGTTDNGTPVYYSLETQDLTFGFRVFEKSITELGITSENISKASLMWRNTSKPEDWKSLGVIDSETQMFDQFDIRGARFNFKISESTDSGRATIKSIDFPQGIKVFDNTN